MIAPNEALRILESKEQKMALGGRAKPSARQSEARQRVKPAPLDQAFVALVRARGIANEPGSPVDGDSSDVQAIALKYVPAGRLPLSNRRVSRPLFEVGDEFLVEQMLWRARRKPLAERLTSGPLCSKPESLL